jgi:IMP cyclohydrolase
MLMDTPTTARRNLARLSQNPYPGRGIVLGLNSAGTHFLQIYWVMGRSASSRNRAMVVDGDTIRLQPVNPDPLQDQRLLIYTAMKNVGAAHIVTNGDHTETIAQHLSASGSFVSALLSREHEPDDPHFTARISGLIELGSAGPKIAASKISSDSTNSNRSVHCFYTYTGFEPGTGICLHTYAGNDNPLPPFDSDPYLVSLGKAPEEVADAFWSTLNSENRVALAVKAVECETGFFCLAVRNQIAAS